MNAKDWEFESVKLDFKLYLTQEHNFLKLLPLCHHFMLDTMSRRQDAMSFLSVSGYLQQASLMSQWVIWVIYHLAWWYTQYRALGLECDICIDKTDSKGL